MTATFSFAELVQATQARVLQPPPAPDRRFSIGTDSRHLKAHDLFLPLVGERFDGHDYLGSLGETGVCVAFCEERYYNSHFSQLNALENLTFLLVKDTLEALQALARFHRRRSLATVIGLTGSSGKSTLKEYLFHVFKQSRPTQATLGNYNNDIGVAQTLLALEEDTEIAIVEMGMRGLGEIRRLSLMAEPDIGLLINIGPAHIELLGTLENTAMAKCELVEGLKSTLVSNGNDPYLEARLAELSLAHLTHWRYDMKDAEHMVALPDGTFRFSVEGVAFHSPLPGKHQVSNLLGVIKIAKVLGLSTQAVADALASFTSQSGRFERLQLPNSNTLINDAYNANPASMNASLNAFFATSLEDHPARILILGSMKELGQASLTYHADVYKDAATAQGVQGVVLVGQEWQGLALNENTVIYPTTEDFLHALESFKVDCINTLGHKTPIAYFLKGSRFHALERVIPYLASYPYTASELGHFAL
jgi:UDP-N-acetylmuramoyl-tripeptide--D-alanyl-D-alanine ligase